MLPFHFDGLDLVLTILLVLICLWFRMYAIDKDAEIYIIKKDFEEFKKKYGPFRANTRQRITLPAVGFLSQMMGEEKDESL